MPYTLENSLNYYSTLALAFIKYLCFNFCTKTTNRQTVFSAKPTDELKKDQISLQNEIYTIVTKYLGLRELALKLKTVYENSKSQQPVQRYYLLKHLIKDILRSSTFLSICHEIDDF